MDQDDSSILQEGGHQGQDTMVELRNIDNFILKIEELNIKNPKVLSQLKENIIYIECKVPLFKMDQVVNEQKDKKAKEAKNKDKNQVNTNQVQNDGMILYDTFK